MKTIVIELGNEEYERLLKIKGNKRWKDLLFNLYSQEYVINNVNNTFSLLKTIYSDKSELYEYLRVISLRLVDNPAKALEIARQLEAGIKDYLERNNI